MIKLYIYNIADGHFLYEDSGQPEFIIIDLGNDKDFTMAPPPDYTQQWRWIDNKWIADNAP